MSNKCQYSTTARPSHSIEKGSQASQEPREGYIAGLEPHDKGLSHEQSLVASLLPKDLAEHLYIGGRKIMTIHVFNAHGNLIPEDRWPECDSDDRLRREEPAEWARRQDDEAYHDWHEELTWEHNHPDVGSQ